MSNFAKLEDIPRKPVVRRYGEFVAPHFKHESVWDTTVRFLGLSAGEEIAFEAFCLANSPRRLPVTMIEANACYQAWRLKGA